MDVCWSWHERYHPHPAPTPNPNPKWKTCTYIISYNIFHCGFLHARMVLAARIQSCPCQCGLAWFGPALLMLLSLSVQDPACFCHCGTGNPHKEAHKGWPNTEPKLQRSGGCYMVVRLEIDWSMKSMMLVLTKHTGQISTWQVDRIMVHRGTICLSSYRKVRPRLPWSFWLVASCHSMQTWATIMKP